MRIDISGYQFQFPQQCACCGARAEVPLIVSATQTQGKGRLLQHVTRAWSIPYCRQCLRHIRAFELSLLLFLCFLGLAATIAVLVLAESGSPMDALTYLFSGIGGSIALVLLFLLRAFRLKHSGCVGISRSVSYLGWQGSQHSFEVRSWKFAHAFMSANERKLVNLSPHVVRSLQQAGLDQGKAPQTARRYLPRTRK